MSKSLPLLSDEIVSSLMEEEMSSLDHVSLKRGWILGIKKCLGILEHGIEGWEGDCLEFYQELKVNMEKLLDV